MYYDTYKGLFIYLSRDKWQVSVEIPSALKGADLKTAVQVELKMNTNTPQTTNAEHREKYKVKSEKEKSGKEQKKEKEYHRKEKR